MINENKQTILVVEDDNILRQNLQDCISTYFECKTAPNVDEALSILSTYKIDLILSDILMPGKTGLDLLKTLMSNPRFNNIPILLLSALNSDEHLKKGYQAGAIDYITKPFKLSILIEKINSLIRLKKKFEIDPLKIIFNKNKEFADRYERNDYKEKIEKIITENYDNPNLRLEDIAQQLNISPSTLQRYCKKYTGTTANKLVHNYRLQLAEMMILKSNLSIGEIAFCTGFSSLQYFSKCFKKAYGKYPSSYTLK